MSKPATSMSKILSIDPVTRFQVSSLPAKAICMRPSATLILIHNVESFAAAHHLAHCSQTMLRYRRLHYLNQWIATAARSEVYALRQFAKALRRDEDTIRNALVEPWSSGQVEGQVNRLKTSKRSMYGRAGIGLLRARLLLPA